LSLRSMFVAALGSQNWLCGSCLGLSLENADAAAEGDALLGFLRACAAAPLGCMVSRICASRPCISLPSRNCAITLFKKRRMDLSFSALDVGTPSKAILHGVSGRLVPGAFLGFWGLTPIDNT